MGKSIAGWLLACVVGTGAQEWTPLFDKELSNFEVWMGIPHETVGGLPPGTPVSKDCHEGTPLGLGNDPRQVFTMTEAEGEPVLHVSGEIFGGLTTIKEYGNYHLRIMVKWGEKKWPPRLDQLRDSGILYHCHGAHGAFWGVWKASAECQVQEGDLGDFISLAGTSGQVRIAPVEGTKRPRFDSSSDQYGGGYVSAYPEPDVPHGEWNLMEIYAVGDTSVHVVNGQVVMVVENLRKKDGSPLTSGQIQLQSEAAECFYRRMEIRSIDGFPDAIRSQLRLKKSDG